MRIDDPLDLCAPRNLERASTVNFMMASSLTFLSRQALTPWMQDHLDQMGFESPVRYRLWCHRHGFDSSLEKPDVQLADEIACITESGENDVDIVPSHSEHRARLITQIYEGELEDAPLTDRLTRVRAQFALLADDPSATEAFHRLILHIEKYSRLLTTRFVFPDIGEVEHNTMVSRLGQLARNHRDWIRPLDVWRPENKNEMGQFRELARHFFANYDVPLCFDSVWFSGDDDEARRQQNWYKHVGGGGNLRTAPDLPCKVSKRMAHILSQIRHRRRLLPSMRRAQVQALGAEWRLAGSIAHTPLGESFANEAFWITVSHFFVHNPFLERTYVEPAVDYIQAHKYSPTRVPQPDGSTIQGPPIHPNFSIKGRSAGKLLALVDDWHQDLSDFEEVAGETWEASGIGTLDLEEVSPIESVSDGAPESERLRWRIVELGSSRLLRHEGKVMHHCVGSYARKCVTGEKSIWSLRVCVDDGDAEKHILTIAVDNKRKLVTQARGKYNMQPFDKARVRRNQEGLRHGK